MARCCEFNNSRAVSNLSKIVYNFFAVEHMKVHTYGKLKCEPCQINFTSISLIIHRKRDHPELHRMSRQCNICKDTFATPQSLSIKNANYFVDESINDKKNFRGSQKGS